MAYAAVAMQGVSTAMQVFGALHKGQSDAYNVKVESEARARSAEAQAESDTFNAKVYKQLAEGERTRAAGQAIDYQRSQSENVAALRAKQAASGIAMSGSPLMVDEAIFKEIQFSTDRIAYAGRLAEVRMLNQSDLLALSATRNKDTAIFARAAGATSAENITTASYINALTGAAKGFNDMYKGSLAGGGKAAAAGASSPSFYIPQGTGWF